MCCLRLVLNKNLEERLFTVSEHAENLHGARGPGQTEKTVPIRKSVSNVKATKVPFIAFGGRGNLPHQSTLLMGLVRSHLRSL